MSAMSDLDAAVNVAGMYSREFSDMAETISLLRDQLDRCHRYAAELEHMLAETRERLNAEQQAHAATKRRAGLDEESLAKMLALVV